MFVVEKVLLFLVISLTAYPMLSADVSFWLADNREERVVSHVGHQKRRVSHVLCHWWHHNNDRHRVSCHLLWRSDMSGIIVFRCMGGLLLFHVWMLTNRLSIRSHDDVIEWKNFPRYCPFVLPVNSPQKGLWRGALMFSLICAWINGWVSNNKAGDLRRHRANYDITVKWIRCLSFASYLCLLWPE